VPHTMPVPSPAITVPAATITTGAQPSYPGIDAIGLAAGGAKDIANFRDNIRNRFLPLPTDVTYEGLFYDYYLIPGPQGPRTSFSVLRTAARSRAILFHIRRSIIWRWD
jgi:hypothetical protein